MSGNILYRLEERCLIKVSGDDAESFLQNLVTQDVAGLAPEKLVYGCLLTPQGRFLHDFFIFRTTEGFFLECETARRGDLLRRLTMFRLRSKVILDDCAALFAVYADAAPEGERGLQDPRLEALGCRLYLPVTEKREAESSAAYKDRRIHLGVPEGSIDIRPEADTMADANLDLLQAVSWNKGCFVGQEVAARMENRGLVKKRMVIVSGQGLAAGEALTQAGHVVGELRSVNAAATEGLAVLKLAALEGHSEPVVSSGGAVVSARLPEWAHP